MSVVQVYLPRLAFDALDHALIKATARFAGIAHATYEASSFRIPGTEPAGSVRVTTNREMAVCLVEALKQQAAKAEATQKSTLADALRTAIERLSAAIEESNTVKDRSPGFGTNS